MERSVKSKQREIVIMAVSCDMTSSNALTGVDKLQFSVNTDHGTGDISLDIASPLQNIVPVVTAETADTAVQVSVTDSNTIRVKCFDSTDGTTAKDAKFHVHLIGSKVSSQY